jgi:phage tail protein X
MTTYTTIQGDTWDWISKKVYGNERFMHHLIEANPKHHDRVFFPANITIRVPDVDVTQVAILPPWKR